MEKVVIGWREKVDLPEWGVTNLLAKIDTGARTSAIHVENIEHIGEKRVRFVVVLSRKFSHKRTTVEAAIVRETKVKSSTGLKEDRIVVETLMRLRDREKRIQLTLVSRERMLCRMLVGRSALEDDFLVDASTTHTGAQS